MSSLEESLIEFICGYTLFLKELNEATEKLEGITLEEKLEELREKIDTIPIPAQAEVRWVYPEDELQDPFDEFAVHSLFFPGGVSVSLVYTRTRDDGRPISGAELAESIDVIFEQPVGVEWVYKPQEGDNIDNKNWLITNISSPNSDLKVGVLRLANLVSQFLG